MPSDIDAIRQEHQEWCDSHRTYAASHYTDLREQMSVVLAALGDAEAALAAAVALRDFMRAPDVNDDGSPADWSPGLDAIGDFYAALAKWEASHGK